MTHEEVSGRRELLLWKSVYITMRNKLETGNTGNRTVEEYQNIAKVLRRKIVMLESKIFSGKRGFLR